jgi:hypothetical protein
MNWHDIILVYLLGMNMMGVRYRVLSDSSNNLLFMACDAADEMFLRLPAGEDWS